MKTFSKVLSMILVGVMCFGLFATSAFASEFVFSDDGGSVAQSADFGGGDFSFESAGSGFSFEGAEPAANDGFTLEAQQPAAQNGGFALNSGDEKADTKLDEDEEVVVDGFKFEDSETFDKRWIKEDAGDYTWSIDGDSEGATFTKGSTANVKIESTGTKKLKADTFDGLAYTKSGSYINPTTIAENNLIKNSTSIELKASWLNTLATGTYFIWGIPALDAPQYLGYIQVNAGNFALYVSNSPYTKQLTAPYDYSRRVKITGSINSMADYGVVPVGNTSGGIKLGGTNYENDGGAVWFSIDFLNSLSAGEYYVVGFPNANNTSEQVKADKTIIIKDFQDPGTGYTLKALSYTTWTSGDDYLLFWSNLMALRKDFKNHSVILRYGYGAGSIPDKEVGVNQYWDFEDGNFALGTNFLNSLPAGTYTLQVIDAKNVYSSTNIVTFRIGAKLVPIDSDKHVINSIRNLRFLCDEPISQVYVGNIPLTYGEDYALSANRKTVTLSYEFLNKRSAGNTYTIKVLTDSGQYCSTTFQILTTAQGGASPRTGDESNLGLWAAFLLLSGTAVVVLLPKLRKHGM